MWQVRRSDCAPESRSDPETSVHSPKGIHGAKARWGCGMCPVEIGAINSFGLGGDWRQRPLSEEGCVTVLDVAATPPLCFSLMSWMVIALRTVLRTVLW